MTLIVEAGDPLSPEALALLQAHHALMESLFPPEDNHYLDAGALTAPDIHFFIVRRSTQMLGCAALAERPSYGEVKSMFVKPEARGTGAADALMRQLEDHARMLKLPLIKLETGDTLHAAHGLYRRHGFRDCGAFGDYDEGASSVFMEKPLT
ncbi:GNAT family N-acetyltransferase [Litoreibacter roseus]|uniref:N-acetyltransferase n=1 Tax=Litoreibacter roseus TaxID=2601869 RepID=A0A6N6JIH1_9RHOB|nr:GNAT family N-acetyltransferase [Litoreibacter roseus]GFE65002.1 N-acetyltransferase [Litoreibacter roseus]